MPTGKNSWIYLLLVIKGRKEATAIIGVKFEGKPIKRLKIKQNMINSEGIRKEVKIEGKHDPCVVPRAVPIVESMTSMVILDYIFINNSRTIRKWN